MATIEEVFAEKENFCIHQGRTSFRKALSIDRGMLQGGQLADRDDLGTLATGDELEIGADKGVAVSV